MNGIFKVNRDKPKRMPRFGKESQRNKNPCTGVGNEYEYTPDLVYRLVSQHKVIKGNLDVSLKFANKGRAYKAFSYLESFRTAHAENVITKKTKLFIELRNHNPSNTTNAVIGKYRTQMSSVNRMIIGFLKKWRFSEIEKNIEEYGLELLEITVIIECYFTGIETELLPSHILIGEHKLTEN